MMLLEKQEASNLRAVLQTTENKILTYTPIFSGTVFDSSSYNIEVQFLQVNREG
jgi:hypothetical protein